MEKEVSETDAPALTGEALVELRTLRHQRSLADRMEYQLETCIDLLERSDPPKGGNTEKRIRGAKTALAAWQKSREADVAALKTKTALRATREGAGKDRRDEQR
jgi:hypothetical protein